MQVTLLLVKVHCTGVLSTLKFHTTFVQKQVQVLGDFHTNTKQMKTFGLVKLVHSKEHTSSNHHVCTTLQTVHLQHVYSAQFLQVNKHLQKQLQKNHT